MWVDASLNPDAFWQQTPRTFQLVMEGVRKRMKREADAQVALAYHTARFSVAAQTKPGLKPLAHYLRDASKPAQMPREMLAVIQSLGAKSNMQIRQIKVTTDGR